MTSGGAKYWNSGNIPLIAPEILGDIINEISDVGVVVDATGKVISIMISPNADGFGNLGNLQGRDFRAALAVESIPKFDERLSAFVESNGPVRPVELNHALDGKRWELPMRYSFHNVGPDGAILLLGRDLRPIAEMQQQLVTAQLALERDYEQQREYETRFRVLMEATGDPVALVSMQSGRVTDANSEAAALFGQNRESLIGRDFSPLFDENGRGDVLDRLSHHALSEGDAPYDMKLQGGTTVAAHAAAFRVAGERLLMCRFARGTPAEEPQSPLSRNLRALFDDGPDAIVFTDATGAILSANDGFLNLLSTAREANVRGKMLTDFLQRGSIDMKVMTENAMRAGQMRNYATKVAGDYGSPRNVEISITAVAAGKSQVFAFCLREANRGDRVQSAAQQQQDDDMQSVVDLVGSATLKEIVAETTNVVEKMCIETAIELTMNNRVAAAEMLGLSRQSLYVKLRKFGIIGKDAEG